MSPEQIHNSILRGGPGDGMLIAFDETTHTLVWDSPWRPLEPGEYRRTDDVEDGRAVFRWAASSVKEGPAGPGEAST